MCISDQKLVLIGILAIALLALLPFMSCPGSEVKCVGVVLAFG